MRKKSNVIPVLLLISILCFNTSFPLAANISNYEAITPRASSCMNCYEGFMVSSTKRETFFGRTELCTQRVDCSVSVNRIESWTTYKCNSCGVGYSNPIVVTYSRTHSKH